MATRISMARRNGACDSVVDAIDNGAPASTLEIRTGAQPATPDTASSGTLLATFTLPDPAFGASSSGTATANAISDTTGVAAGTAGHFRVKDGAGTAVIDGSVGTSGEQLNLNTTTVSVGVAVSITSWTVTMPQG